MDDKGLTVNSTNVDAKTEEVAQKILDSDNARETKDLVSLFNLNCAKKNVLRILKLNGLLDSISDEIIERFEKQPNAYSNSELMDYLQIIQNTIDKASKNLERVDDAPNISLVQNNQVNINMDDSLSRESREKITDAVKSILSRINIDANSNQEGDCQ